MSIVLHNTSNFNKMCQNIEDLRMLLSALHDFIAEEVPKQLINGYVKLLLEVCGRLFYIWLHIIFQGIKLVRLHTFES